MKSFPSNESLDLEKLANAMIQLDFGESTSTDRASEDETSLRFPRIKKFWEEGERTL